MDTRVHRQGRIAQVLLNLAVVTNAQRDQRTLRALCDQSMALSREDENEIAGISMNQGHLLLELPERGVLPFDLGRPRLLALLKAFDAVDHDAAIVVGGVDEAGK